MNQENQKFFNEFFCSRTGEWKQVLVPSLQHATMVKIAIDLWNQIDLKESIVNFRFVNDYRQNHQKWREIEEKALSKVAQLSIPEMLKKDFLSVISPIGLQIKNWWWFHKDEKGLSILPNRFSWTSQGTIDRVKTAECLVKDKNMDVDTRFKLACLYCMEDVIPETWKQLDEEQKQYYYTIDETDQHKFGFLLNFWAYHLKGEASRLDDLYYSNFNAFKSAVCTGNKMAVEYFFGKVMDEETDRHFVMTAIEVSMQHSDVPFSQSTIPNEYYSEVFFILLSRMSKGQKEVVFETFPFKMLDSLLEWPNRPLFVELAKRTIHSKPYDVLGLIIRNIANGWSDCTSRQLFHHFWNLCPLCYKRRAIERISYCTIVKLYEGKNDGIIRALFKHACAKEKEALIMCRREGDICARELMKERGWEPLEEVVVKFKNEFLERCNEWKTLN